MNHQQLLEHAKRIAKEAGEIIMQHYQSGVDIQTKADKTPVTAADLESDAHIRQALREITDYTIISEESTHEQDETVRMWVVDPIDGTKGFISGNGHFAVQIALLEHGRPVLGVVHAPALGQTYWARTGAGAWRNEKRITPTTTDDPEQATIIITTSDRPKEFRDFIQALPHNDLVKQGSYGLRVCKVAAGEADVHPDRQAWPRSWDLAPPAAIIAEAGGRITDAAGNEIRYTLTDAYERKQGLATNGPLHEHYLQLLKEHA